MNYIAGSTASARPSNTVCDTRGAGSSGEHRVAYWVFDDRIEILAARHHH